jgi:hypothetical protein
MKQLDIIQLIEDNPITKLSKDYNVKLLTKIKEKFSNFEQQLFLSSFYCYLKYDTLNDFVINLDDVWKWLEFSTKQKSLMLLEKYFTLNKDYISLLNLKDKQNTSYQALGIKKDNRGGHNKEIFMLNIETFKKFYGLNFANVFEVSMLLNYLSEL